MKIYQNLFKKIDYISLPEIFFLFALISLALFPLVFYMNKPAADSGFVFAFICITAGVAAKIVRSGNWLPSPIFSRNLKLVIFTLLSTAFLYTGYKWSGIPGAIIFLPVITGVILFRRFEIKKPIHPDDGESYIFGKKDLYYTGALLLLNFFSIRKLLTSEPIVYYDWFGFGKEALDFLHHGVLPASPYDFFAAPLIILTGNELATNVFLLAWIPIASVTFYCFAARILRNRTAGFAAAFIYVFNPAVLDRFLSAHIGILIGYALMPLILLLFILSLEKQSYKTSIIFSLTSGALLAFSGLMASHFFYLNAFLLGLFLIFYSVLNRPQSNLKKGIPLLAIVFFTAVILASPWLLSAVRLSTSGYYSASATPSYVESLSTQTYLYNNFRLIGQSGGPFMENINYLGMPFWGLSGFAAVFAGFSALLLHKREKEKSLLIFSSITLAGIILSTGTMYIGELYRWLFANFPFFFGFREPSKFLVIAGFGLSILVGITADAVLSLKGNRLAKFLITLFLSVLLLSQAIFAWPMFTGDNALYSQHPRYTMTREYRELGAWMDSQNETYKVIVLPYTGFTIRTWHMVSKKPMLLINTASLSPLNSDAYQYSIFMFETLERGDASGFAVLAGRENVKYIVIRKDMDVRNMQEAPDEYNFIPPFKRFNQSGPLLARLLEASTEFQKKQEFGPYVVFENKMFMQRTGRIEPKELSELINNTAAIVSNSDKYETMFALLNDEYKINVYDYAFPAGMGDDPRNIIYRRWIRSDIFEFIEGGVFGRGAVTYGRGYAITKGNAQLSISYSPPQDGHYQLWARLLYAPNRGELSVFLDDETIRDISPESSDFEGFKWVKLGEVDIKKRVHKVEIINSHGENVIDQIAFSPAGKR